MRNWFRKSLAALALGVPLAALAAYLAAQAQTVPSNNPTYIPQGIIPVATIPTGVASTYLYNVNGQGTVIFDVAGSPSGLAATVQGTSTRTGTQVWTTIPVDTIGGARVTAIVGTGKYRVSTAGYSQIRLNVTALTSGATTVAFSGGLGQQFATTLGQVRATFSYSALVGTGATTHFMTIAGSATKTVRVEHVECSGGATAANDVSVQLEVDSTADTGDAGSAVTAVPHDSSNVAATAIALTHTTSPTPGALVGYPRSGNLLLAKLGATTPTGATPLVWDFGNRPGAQEVVLRGVAQSMSLNTSAAFGAGAAVGCVIETTEE